MRLVFLLNGIDCYLQLICIAFRIPATIHSYKTHILYVD